MSSNRPVTALATRAANGDRRAWDALVERYAPLVWSICRRYRLEGEDARTVAQAVWLQVADHLGELREPAALAGWLAAATRRECSRARGIPEGQPQAAGQGEQELLAAERDAALREALTRLPPSCQQLIALLAGDKPASYAQISAQLGIPAASIGPRCRRCLGKLRRDPSIAALGRSHRWSRAPERDGQAGRDERRGQDQRMPASAALEGDEVVLGRIEGLDSA
jgi:RNA polymerase sigma factor (sigma-70 family)